VKLSIFSSVNYDIWKNHKKIIISRERYIRRCDKLKTWVHDDQRKHFQNLLSQISTPIECPDQSGRFFNAGKKSDWILGKENVKPAAAAKAQKSRKTGNLVPSRPGQKRKSASADDWLLTTKKQKPSPEWEDFDISLPESDKVSEPKTEPLEESDYTPLMKPVPGRVVKLRIRPYPGKFRKFLKCKRFENLKIS